VKVTINGDLFEWERRMPLKDALALEEECGRSYTEWESMLASGRAWAFTVLAWLLWRRAGRDVPLADLLPGRDEETGAVLDPKVDLNFGEMLASVFEGIAQEAREAAAEEAAKADPTEAAGAAPDGSDTTSPATSRSSRKSSTSGRGR
jgi:hypothetical protein